MEDQEIESSRLSAGGRGQQIDSKRLRTRDREQEIEGSRLSAGGRGQEIESIRLKEKD